MANLELMQIKILDSQFLTIAWPYILLIILAVTFFQFLRLTTSTIFLVFRVFVRTVLLVISWPVYLILLPARALIFLTSLAIKIMFYVAVVAILYRLLGGVLNSVTIKETFGEVLQYMQATFLQQ